MKIKREWLDWGWYDLYDGEDDLGTYFDTADDVFEVYSHFLDTVLQDEIAELADRPVDLEDYIEGGVDIDTAIKALTSTSFYSYLWNYVTENPDEFIDPDLRDGYGYYVPRRTKPIFVPPYPYLEWWEFLVDTLNRYLREGHHEK